MKTSFGTSGVRGLVSSLLGGDAHCYAAAFARYLIASGQVPVGGAVLVAWDLRESSPQIAEICKVCIEDAGLVAVLCGDIPTPALALAALERRLPAMMITGSHIPADRNGIKFYRADGEISKADEEAISTLATADFDRRNLKTQSKVDWSSENSCVTAAYLDRCMALLPPKILGGLSVGVYEHSSVSRDILHQILQHYGANTISLSRSAHFVPIDTEAVSAQTRTQLQDWAAERDFAAIVSTDGDGDRPLLADERGQVVSGDVLGILAARMLDASTLVTPVTSNSGIENVGNWKVVRTRVGSPYVIAGMKNANGAVLGFEANGGVLIGSGFILEGRPLAELATRDCIVPLLAALAAVAASKTTISEIVADLALPATASDRLQEIPSEISSSLILALQTDEQARRHFLEDFAPLSSIDMTDGLRMSLTDGCIVHLRPSGNAPELRCYIESPSAAQSDRMLQLCLQRAARFCN